MTVRQWINEHLNSNFLTVEMQSNELEQFSFFEDQFLFWMSQLDILKKNSGGFPGTNSSQRPRISLVCWSGNISWGWQSAGESMHYRLRRPIGLWKVQKVGQSRHLFLIEPTKQKILHFLRLLWPRSCAKNYFIFFSESKYCQNHGQCSEKVERGLIRGWFSAWWKYRPCREKKL